MKKPFWNTNIGRGGRLIRAGGALLLVAGGWLAWPQATWLALLFWASAGFVMFEALKGWCLLRACGLKTRF